MRADGVSQLVQQLNGDGGLSQAQHAPALYWWRLLHDWDDVREQQERCETAAWHVEPLTLLRSSLSYRSEPSSPCNSHRS